MKSKSESVSGEAPETKGTSDKRNVAVILIRLICDAVIVLLSLFFLLCLLYFIDGSQEISPTEEQNEKIRVVMAALMFLSGIPCIVCIAVRVRCRKRRENIKIRG